MHDRTSAGFFHSLSDALLHPLNQLQKNFSQNFDAQGNTRNVPNSHVPGSSMPERDWLVQTMMVTHATIAFCLGSFCQLRWSLKMNLCHHHWVLHLPSHMQQATSPDPCQNGHLSDEGVHWSIQFSSGMCHSSHEHTACVSNDDEVLGNFLYSCYVHGTWHFTCCVKKFNAHSLVCLVCELIFPSLAQMGWWLCNKWTVQINELA